MKFVINNPSDYMMLDTAVENIFINEHMVSAPGDYVKVYLFGRMYAAAGEELSTEMMARQLGMKPSEIKAAWLYWEKAGVVSVVRTAGEEQVSFNNLKALKYGKSTEQKQQQNSEQSESVLEDQNIQDMYKSIERILGRPISGTETLEILSWITDLGAEPEIIVYAYSHCFNKGKDSVRYVAAVVKRWVSEGLGDVLAVEEYLDRIDQRYLLHKRVLKALGFMRNATEEEKNIMDRWFDEMNYSIDKVLDACKRTSGISNPNINYVNRILVNWFEKETGKKVDEDRPDAPKPVTATDIQKYYNYLKNRAEEEARRKTQEIYDEIPEIASLEEELNSYSMKIVRLSFRQGSDKDSEIANLQKIIDDLTQEKAILLTEHDYAIDYMDVDYRCKICKDTGTNDEGGRCECYSLRAKEAETWLKNQNTKDEN